MRIGCNGRYLFASPAFAQDSTVNPFAAAGCEVNEIHFNVKNRHNATPNRTTRLWKGFGLRICRGLVRLYCRPLWNAADTIRNRWHVGRSERLQALLFLPGGTRRSPFVYRCSIEVRVGGQIFLSGDQLHGLSWQDLLLPDKNAEGTRYE